MSSLSQLHPYTPCRPVHGLIFLYKWRAEETVQGSVVRDSRLDDIFFAKQVTHTHTDKEQTHTHHTHTHREIKNKHTRTH